MGESKLKKMTQDAEKFMKFSEEMAIKGIDSNVQNTAYNHTVGIYYALKALYKQNEAIIELLKK